MKTLILVVDRDDDIGRLLGVEGPVIGEKEVLKVGVELLKKDPNETDGNAIFKGLSIFDSLKIKDKEIAIVTGSQNVGTESDMNIAAQLEKIFRRFPAEAVIFVSDGPEDEGAIPVVESYAKVIGVERVSVKSPALKSLGYTLLSFFQKIKSSKNLRRSLMILPGIILLAYGLLGELSWRLLGIIIGAYLIIEALKKEILELNEKIIQVFHEPQIFVAALIGIATVIKLFFDAIKLSFSIKSLLVFLNQEELLLYILLISAFIIIAYLTGMDKKRVIINFLILFLFIRGAALIARWSLGFIEEFTQVFITFVLLLLVIIIKWVL